MDSDRQLPRYRLAGHRRLDRDAARVASWSRRYLGPVAGWRLWLRADQRWDLRSRSNERLPARCGNAQHYQRARHPAFRQRGHRLPRADRGLLRVCAPICRPQAARLGGLLGDYWRALPRCLLRDRLRIQAIGSRPGVLRRGGARLGMDLGDRDPADAPAPQDQLDRLGRAAFRPQLDRSFGGLTNHVGIDLVAGQPYSIFRPITDEGERPRRRERPRPEPLRRDGPPAATPLMLQYRSLLLLILRPDHRRTEAGGLGSVCVLNAEAQDLVVHFASTLARPSAKTSQAVHRIPDFPFEAGGDHDLELETAGIGGDVLDGHGCPGRSGKDEIDRNRFTKHIIRPHPFGPPV